MELQWLARPLSVEEFDQQSIEVMEIFGFLTLGTITGWLSYRVLGKRGIKMLPSIVVGAIAALIGGLVVMYFGLVGSGYYAAITSIGTLFTINAFRKKEPIFPEPEN